MECKAPQIAIVQATFDQLAQYNRSLSADLLMVTNGLDHYFCTVPKGSENYTFLKDIPEFNR